MGIDYRPISNMYSILARRFEMCCPPDVRQRGIIRTDDTLDNSAVLDAVLGDSRSKLRECHTAVLDFSKAFDTISHASLVILLNERGLPEAFCSYVAPLTPLLFNVVMDLVFANLPKNVGYRLEGELISALTYADDLVLLAGSKVGMQSAIDAVQC